MHGNSGWNKLNHALKVLRNAWDQTESGWRDQKRVEFEKDCIAPLETSVDSSLRAMKRLSEVLAQVHRDCRDTYE